MKVICYKRIKLECEYVNKRSGFNHRAKLYIDGEYERKDICQYENRTWESFPFQTVMMKVIRNSKELSDAEKLEFAGYYKLDNFEL